MFSISINAELLTYLLAALSAAVFDWFPGVAGWFDGLSALKKQQFMGLLLAGIVLLIYGGTCAGVFSTGYGSQAGSGTISCDKSGFAALVQVYLLAVGINQGVHLLGKPGRVPRGRMPSQKSTGTTSASTGG